MINEITEEHNPEKIQKLVMVEMLLIVPLSLF